MTRNSRNPAEPTPTPPKPYEAPALKEFGTIAELTRVLNSPNTAKDAIPASTKT